MVVPLVRDEAEKLTLKVEGAGTGAGTINGMMAFDLAANTSQQRNDIFIRRGETP